MISILLNELKCYVLKMFLALSGIIIWQPHFSC